MRKIFNIIIYFFAGIGFILVGVYFALGLGLTKTSGIIDTQHDYFKNQVNGTASSTSTSVEAWQQSEEWQILKAAIVNDTAIITAAGNKVGVQPRLIVSILIVEQLRLFYSEREIFKSVFAPLKILGNQSQFSWGVMGVKQDTARQIENNLTDKASPWYLGAEYSHLLDYSATTTDTDTARFARLTDEHDRYYSYLYGAVLIKEAASQWQNAGFPISDRPDLIATLFNIGFTNSKPNATPQVGGAEIDIGSTTYSFGGLAGSFYASDELIDEFPR